MERTLIATARFEVGVQGLVNTSPIPPASIGPRISVRTQPRADVEGHKEGLLAHRSICPPRQGIGEFLRALSGSIPSARPLHFIRVAFPWMTVFGGAFSTLTSTCNV